MTAILPVLLLMTSLVPAVVTFFLAQHHHVLRNGIQLGGAVLKLGLIVWMLFSVANGAAYEVAFPLAPGLVILLRVDALALLFISLSATLWFLTTVYAIAYFGTKAELSRFFGFFSLCVAATTGLALSGSLISFFIFFELLTLSTWPLVAHKQDKPSLAAARVYLGYALPGSAALLWAIIWLESATGPVLFTEPPDLSGLDPADLRAIFALFIIGVGVKAGLVPLHGWLPAAMAAPAPVSALLHAVAVVKAGAFGVVRVVYDVFGAENMAALGVGVPLAIVASITIIWGSIRALQQNEIKRRLAFSTVSQVSYIVLGAALASPLAMIGGLVHLIHQGLMKITLFFCAGIYDERAGVKRIDGLNGMGPLLPWTSVCFSLAAMGMIGLPPLAGFVSKFYLGLGAIEAGAPWVLGVLLASTLLNAAYFLPILYRLWFLPLAEGVGARSDHRCGHPGGRRPGGQPDQPAGLGHADRHAGVGAMSALYSGSLAPFAVLLWPLLIGMVPIVPRWRDNALRLLPLAPLPALVFALAGAPGAVVFPDLMLGVELAAGPDTALLLGMTAMVWVVAGFYGALTMKRGTEAGIFTGFWCLTLAGNLGVFLAADIITFYLAFAAVSLAAWFLVVHDRTKAAISAGRVYILLAVLGEAALLTGLMIGASAAEDLHVASVRAAFADAPLGSFGVGLLIAGFGIKAGMVPLHVWLSLAHPAAPVAGSAVLSGAIVKAGLIGMVLLVPTETGWGSVLIVLGLTGGFGAALWGLTQRNPKAVLAYSTVSQMGLLLVLVGAGSQGVAYFALHHGLAKGALFLCVGLMMLSSTPSQRWAVLGLAGLVALSVTGLPLTGGALAKLAGKAGISEPLALAMTLSSVTTTLILGWFLARLADLHRAEPARAPPWGWLFAAVLLLAATALAVPWVLWSDEVDLPPDYPIRAANMLEALWPILGGLVLLAVLRRLALPDHPPGDLLNLLRGWTLRPALQLPIGGQGESDRTRPVLRLLLLCKQAEQRLLHWPVSGAALIGTALLLTIIVLYSP